MHISAEAFIFVGFVGITLLAGLALSFWARALLTEDGQAKTSDTYPTSPYREKQFLKGKDQYVFSLLPGKVSIVAGADAHQQIESFSVVGIQIPEHARQHSDRPAPRAV